MISATYKNPYEVRFKPHYNYQSHQHHQGTPPWVTPPTPPNNVVALPAPLKVHQLAVTRSVVVGITTAEWQRRNYIVETLLKECKMTFMDEFYPFNEDWYKRYGKCVYLGRVDGYYQIDKEDWPLNDHPLLFQARAVAPLNHADAVPFLCNLAFMCKAPPKGTDA